MRPPSLSFLLIGFAAEGLVTFRFQQRYQHRKIIVYNEKHEGAWFSRLSERLKGTKNSVDEKKERKNFKKNEELELSAKLRASVLTDKPLSTVLRDFGTDELSLALKAIVPDEAAIHRIISAADTTILPMQDASLVSDIGNFDNDENEAQLRMSAVSTVDASSLDNCIDLMVKGKYLDAYDALEGLFGESNHMLHRTSALLRGLCASELGAADLEALLKAPPQYNLEAPIRDILQARLELEASEPRSAYAMALCAASRPGLTPGVAELAKQYLAKADALIVQEDSTTSFDSMLTTEEANEINDNDQVKEEEEEDIIDSEAYEVRAKNSASLSKLRNMVGLNELKDDWLQLKESVAIEKERKEDPHNKQYSILLAGKSGIGKTSLGRIYSQLIIELGHIIPETDPPRYVDTTGSKCLQMQPADFATNILSVFDDDGKGDIEDGDAVLLKNRRYKGIGRICYEERQRYDIHFGDSVEMKVDRSEIIQLKRLGGILFIDEAWKLEPSSNSAGRVIIDMLIEAMEMAGGRLVVIFTGPEDKLDDLVYSDPNNPGFASRFRSRYVLPDFEDDEIETLMHRILKAKKPQFHFNDNRFARIAAKRLGRQRTSSSFANARAVEKLVDTIGDRQTARVLKARRTQDNDDIDIFEITRDDALGPRDNLRARVESSDAWQELQGMYGLERVKESVSQLITMVETNTEREELELPLQKGSLNRVFLGHPGTGKTTVAKLYGAILRELGLLSKGDLVVTNPSDFIGSALGQSEEKTAAILEKAKGCVLVIDEAYGLHPSPAGGRGQVGQVGDPYKTAVIDTIVARVQGVPGEDQCVLLLGYKREMEDLVRNANPGLVRRFQLDNAFEFDDYDDDALFRILMAKVKARGRLVGFDAARAAVRKKLAKERLRPNFGNAGSVENLVSDAIARAEKRIQEKHSGCATSRAQDLELIETDFYDEPPHFANPEEYVFEGLTGCETIKEKLKEYQAVVDACRASGRDPIEDVPLSFVFSGSPGTGKTTIAKRMGMLYEALGILPSSDVHVCSASDFSTGYVGQAARKTREYFENARGAVLFIDEAYRLYDPHGRSYFQEATDEIVSMLTEDEFKGKMVVIFAGYPGPMRTMLDNVNPGLKSRVTELINFPDFDAKASADLAELQLVQRRRMNLLEADLTKYTQRLINAPNWANGRDVETWVKRIASEAAKAGQATQVDAQVLERATQYMIQHKAPLDVEDDTSVASTIRITDDLREASLEPRQLPKIDIQIAKELLLKKDGNDEEPDDSSQGNSLKGLLEKACVACGYDESVETRSDLRDALSSGQIPEDVLSYVRAREKSMNHDELYAALLAEVSSIVQALSAKINYDRSRAIRMAQLTKKEREEEEAREEAIQNQLQHKGKCPAGFDWFREGAGWRCGGGSHYVSDDDPILHGL